MIELFHNGKYSLTLAIDINGIKEILDYLNSFNVKHSFTKLRYNENEVNFQIIQNENPTNICISKGFVSIEMDGDEIEYFIERLENCKNSNGFFPAELCERTLKGKNMMIYVKYS